MDPIAVLALALSLATAIFVVANAARNAGGEGTLADATDALDNSSEMLGDAAIIMQDAAKFTAVGNQLQRESVAALEKAARETELANQTWAKATEDSEPIGAELTIPTAFATWRDDGDSHYVQVTNWINGGGIDVQMSINRAACSLAMTWKELDVMYSLADRLRAKDEEATDKSNMVPVGGDDPRVIAASEAEDFPEVDMNLFWGEMVEGAKAVESDENAEHPYDDTVYSE